MDTSLKNRVHKRPHNKSSSKSIRQKFFGSFEWNAFRLNAVAVAFCAIWASLWIRAGYIQLWEGSDLEERARRQHISLETVSIPRRSIMDRNGKILAKSIECYSVYANPRKIVSIHDTAKELAGYLGNSKESLIQILSKPTGFTWVSRHIDDATATAIKNANIPGVMLIREYERVYPYKEMAGQLIGFVGIDGFGLEGIERSFDTYLNSPARKQIVQRDASGRTLYVSNKKSKNVLTNDLWLTIDLQMQSIAEDVIAQTVESVDAKWGGVLVIDVKTGEVLAWSQYPFFNPNAYRESTPSEYRNRIALDAFEPGSTFKPFLIASALQEGVVTKDTMFDCENGLWKINSISIRDDGRAHQELSVSDILVKSSNIGCGKISLELGAQHYHHYLEKLGFGQPAGLNMAESRGILRRPREWSEADLISTGFGQSISTTLVQLAQGFLTIVNGGVYKPLKISLHTEDARCGDKEIRIYDKGIAEDVVSMMQDVVTRGTGRRAAIEGIQVAGKTGTAQKASRAGAYGEDRLASFLGVAPGDDPKYLVAIVVDEPKAKKYGGLIAAPAFRNLMTRILAYQGFLPDKSRYAKKQNSSEGIEKLFFSQNVTAKKVQQTRHTSEFKKDTGDVTAKGISEDTKKVDVPDVKGKSIRYAVEAFAQKGLIPEIKGSGTIVVKQEPEAGSVGEEKQQRYILWLSEK